MAIAPNGAAVTYGADQRPYQAVLWYCSVDDDELAAANAKALRDAGVPCWPSLASLERWGDRRDKLRAAAEASLVNNIELLEWSPGLRREFDVVLKVGNLHVGAGKYRVNAGEPFPKWEGLASLEPFVDGRSVRVYVVGDVVGLVEYLNDESWIKNGPGADVVELDDAKEEFAGLIAHAKKAHALFGLPVSGVDYIVEPDGSFRFLEHNHFPGVTLHPKVEEEIVRLFEEAMDVLERGESA